MHRSWVFLFFLTLAYADPDADPNVSRLLSGVKPFAACPDGFVLEGSHTCIRVVQTSEFIIQCPEGSLQNGKCVVREAIQDELSCLPGFHLNDDLQCERQIYEPAIQSCEPNYTLHGGECVWSGSQVMCPDGFQLQGKQCHRHFTSQPRAVCPQNSIRNTAGLCQMMSSTPAQKTCPEDFQLFDNQCIRPETVPGIIDCPPGFSREGDSCISEMDVTDDGYTCLAGMVRTGATCTVLEQVQAQLLCRNGFRFHATEKKCINERASRHAVTCNRGFKLDVLTGECVGFFETTGVLICPHGYLLVDKRCSRANVERPVSICPRGFEKSSGLCIRRSVKQPDVVCPKGTKDNGGKCSLVIESKPEHVCPAGSIMKGGKQCEFREVIPAQLKCAHGTLDGASCIEQVDKPAKLSCPKGFLLSGASCVMKLQVEAEPICEVGVLRGQHCEVLRSVSPVNPVSPVDDDAECRTKKCHKHHEKDNK